MPHPFSAGPQRVGTGPGRPRPQITDVCGFAPAGANGPVKPRAAGARGPAPASFPPAAPPICTSRQSLLQYSPGRPLNVGFPQPLRQQSAVLFLHSLLQNSLGLPFQVGLLQPLFMQMGAPPAEAAEDAAAGEVAAAGGAVAARCPTRHSLADRTASCHLASRAFPVRRSTEAWMKEVHGWPGLSESSSLTSISCSPSQFLPSPSQLSDQTLSRPATALCSRRKASPVSTSFCANLGWRVGWNFSLSTESIPFQLPPLPP
mmetsp:Transcript_116480/g.340786  ORF Transcript_116480/g.340786 Transcript_116480/m.340786 type:complete len:260 (+) Transcript_116480:76-855(+)